MELTRLAAAHLLHSDDLADKQQLIPASMNSLLLALRRSWSRGRVLGGGRPPSPVACGAARTRPRSGPGCACFACSTLRIHSRSSLHPANEWTMLQGHSDAESWFGFGFSAQDVITCETGKLGDSTVAESNKTLYTRDSTERVGLGSPRLTSGIVVLCMKHACAWLCADGAEAERSGRVPHPHGLH